ncbi:hypothetical protein HU200_030818 [Digitaria exilis]|uniref:Cation/H+ exchanger domain-containing protein n=1 Tax=Digitaria exilis TaxID=1010633 RepID=A0A835EN85_9POAL|nr:hypothetical protein HU200_030818 [Digitaria exilis]
MAVVDPLAELWKHLMSLERSDLLCLYPSKITMGGIWMGDNPIDFSLPLLLFQIILITTTTRLVALILTPLRLPRYIAEILAGFLLGPSVLGRVPHFSDLAFPIRSLFILESMSLLGLIYYTFTIGVEIELHTLLRAGFRSFWFAAASALPPFLVGATTGYVAVTSSTGGSRNNNLNTLSFPVFLGATFCSTAFSVLARNIAQLKLAGTDVGQLSISASLINDTFAWAGLTVATALAHVRFGTLPCLWTLVSGFLIVGASCLVVRPMLLRLAARVAEGEVVTELHECSVLVGVMAAALVADAGGTHAIFGAFVFGLAVPNGPVGVAIVEKVEDLVVGTLLPLFFAMSGLRTDTAKITSMGAAALLMCAALAAAVLKVVAAVVVAGVFGMPLHDGVSIGLLLNTKGIIELVILNIGKNKGIMSDQSFTVLVFMSALITALVTPLLALVVKPARRLVFYKRRTIAWAAQPDAELRVLACVHVPRDVPALLTLLDVASPSSDGSPVAVQALHLIEFAGRSSALLLINASAPSSSFDHSSAHGRSQVELQFKHISHAFMAYEENVGGVSVRGTVAAVSPYESMHDDVTSAAEDQHSALILLPFHKRRSLDGGLETFHPAIQGLNQSIQRFSPCTVGVLVDRGLGGVPGAGCRVAALFFGGRDDREVVALATRMVYNPAIDLTVLRFVLKGGGGFGGEFDALKERKADDACLREFLDRANAMSVGGGAGAGVEYRERGVFNAGEMVAQVREVEALGKDLFVVGKVPGLPALTASMAEWSECPELGPIGDLLASKDFHTMASVLVLQSYARPSAGAISSELGLGGDALPGGGARPPRPDPHHSRRNSIGNWS